MGPLTEPQQRVQDALDDLTSARRFGGSPDMIRSLERDARNALDHYRPDPEGRMTAATRERVDAEVDHRRAQAEHDDARDHLQANPNDPQAQQQAAEADARLRAADARVQQAEATRRQALTDFAEHRDNDRRIQGVVDGTIRHLFPVPPGPGDQPNAITHEATPGRGSLQSSPDPYVVQRQLSDRGTAPDQAIGGVTYMSSGDNVSIARGGTLFHERIHSHTHTDFHNAFPDAPGSKVNHVQEGFTEYFTQHVREQTGLGNHPAWDRSNVYTPQTQATQALINRLGGDGHNVAANAFFQGDVNTLNARLGPNAGQIMDHFRNGRFNDFHAALNNVPAGGYPVGGGNP